MDDTLLSERVLCRFRLTGTPWSGWALRLLCLRRERCVLCISDPAETQSFHIRSCVRHHYAPVTIAVLVVRCLEGQAELRWDTQPFFLRDKVALWESGIGAALNAAALQHRRLVEDLAQRLRTCVSSSVFPMMPRRASAPLLIPALNVLVMVVGTRGDIVPLALLAAELAQRGHKVRVATHSVFRDLVTSHHPAVDFFPIPGDPQELSRLMRTCYGGSVLSSAVGALAEVPHYCALMRRIFDGLWDAFTTPLAAGAGSAGFQAIVSNPVAYAHVHIAEKTGAALHVCFPQPWVRTKAFPHPLFGSSMSHEPWSLRNAFTYDALDCAIFLAMQKALSAFRVEVLGLEPLSSLEQGWNLPSDLKVPFTGLFSPSLIPAPKDWPEHCRVTGACYPRHSQREAEGTSHVDALFRCVASVVFVGFGSMAVSPAEVCTLVALAAYAISALQIRVLLQLSPQDCVNAQTALEHICAQTRVVMVQSIDDLRAVSESSELIVLACFLEHEAVFKHCSALVHHGGSGTAHCGLRLGKPTMILPFFADQFSFGALVHRRGCGPRPLPISQHTEATFLDGIRVLLDPRTVAAAEELSRRLCEEDGVIAAVESWEQLLPLGELLCEPSLVSGVCVAATARCRRCGMRMSARFVEAAASGQVCDGRGCDVEPARYVDWTSRRRRSSTALVVSAVVVTKDVSCAIYRHLRAVTVAGISSPGGRAIAGFPAAALYVAGGLVCQLLSRGDLSEPEASGHLLPVLSMDDKESDDYEETQQLIVGGQLHCHCINDWAGGDDWSDDRNPAVVIHDMDALRCSRDYSSPVPTLLPPSIDAESLNMINNAKHVLGLLCEWAGKEHIREFDVAMLRALLSEVVVRSTESPVPVDTDGFVWALRHYTRQSSSAASGSATSSSSVVSLFDLLRILVFEL